MRSSIGIQQFLQLRLAAHVPGLRDRQGLDGFDVVADRLRGIPQIDRALGVEPELGECWKSFDRRSASSGLDLRAEIAMI